MTIESIAPTVPAQRTHAWWKGWTFRMTGFRVFLMTLVGLAAGAYVYRFVFGLSESTNLSNQWPWGLWIWQVLAGIALTGGGYSTALFVHFAGRDEWEGIERAAFLTSLIGYLMVLLVYPPELGRWFNFWRPAVFWGYHSALFEVYWCISLYTIVQLAKFGHIYTERVHAPRLERAVHKVYVPLLILGVVLPTLHHSSLGSLYVVAKGILDPLWWSMLIPAFFLLSSFFVGPAMVTIVTVLHARATGNPVPKRELSGLVKVGAWLMVIYLVLRVGDLVYRGQLHRLWEGSLQSNMLLVEVGLCVMVPAAMFLIPRSRRSTAGIFLASVLTAAGVALNRANVVMTGMAKSTNGVGYIPSWAELAVTVGIVAAGILAYLFVTENFPIVPKPAARARAALVSAEE